MMSAAAFLVALRTLMPPTGYPELERYARVALASEQLVQQQWEYAALYAVFRGESFLKLEIHDGTVRGKAGEVCIAQIHPGNPAWRDYAEDLSELAGTDLESTRKCIAAALQTLRRSRAYCWNRNYRTNWRRATFTMYHLGDRCWLSKRANARLGWMLLFESRQWTATWLDEDLIAEARREVLHND